MVVRPDPAGDGSTEVREPWQLALLPEQFSLVGALWGKSGMPRGVRVGDPNLLLQHLFDTAAVAELLWDDFLSAALQGRIDAVADGIGRRFFCWICALHDIGKGTPGFQGKCPTLAHAVQAVGLQLQVDGSVRSGWRHEIASALILIEALGAEWPEEAADWVWPLVAGHHGRVPSRGTLDELRRKPRHLQRFYGTSSEWYSAREALLGTVTRAVGYHDVADATPVSVPTRADQLVLSGLMVMADWIASDEANFPGVPVIEDVSMSLARTRAQRAWGVLGLGRGWGQLVEPTTCQIAARFGYELRPAQRAVLEAAQALPSPGLLIVEVPTGEGKTEAGLGAAEILAARFGADGVFMGLPTQATSDAMLDRVVGWLNTFDPAPEVALVHGARRMNESWERLVLLRSRRARGAVDAGAAAADESGGAAELDEYGLPVELPPAFSAISEDVPFGDGAVGTEDQVEAASSWFEGAKRGLLAPNGVGTIDQVLYAGTRTKHVMLRYAGLAGKVVVLDEVHAADSYMAVFLGEVLAWLGLGQVPVVLLSATLAPAQRRSLVESYLKGATREPNISEGWAEDVRVYPAITSVWAEAGSPRHAIRPAEPWRQPQAIVVELLSERDGATERERLRRLLTDRLSDGGCALVIRNTVARAQELYDELASAFADDEVVLLHSRFTAGDRARRTRRLLDQLGPETRSDRSSSVDRPYRLVVVATQVAEQSFDVDVDLLVTDLAPVDLLVQRAGRLHRHARRSARPPQVDRPRMVVTGVDLTGREPWFPKGSEMVYHLHPLIRTAALLGSTVGEVCWLLPDDVPRLIRLAYGDEGGVPAAWTDAAEAAESAWREHLVRLTAPAENYRLVPRGSWTAPTLAGLHARATEADAEETVRVRDGEMGVEVVLLVRGPNGYKTLDGNALGLNGEAVAGKERAVLAGTLRLPAHDPKVTAAAEELRPLPEWSDHPLLRQCRVLSLGADLQGLLGGISVRYDRRRGAELGPRHDWER